MQLYEISDVRATEEPNVYVVLADITDNVGQRETVDFVSRPTDVHGLGPDVRAAVESWISSGYTVQPYVPEEPTPEELRASMPDITPRQLCLALFSIGITEADVVATLTDPQDLIEWNKATRFTRLHPLVVSTAQTFSLSPEQVDSLWDWAAGL